MSTTVIIVLIIIVAIIALVAVTQSGGPKVTVVKTENEDRADDA